LISIALVVNTNLADCYKLYNFVISMKIMGSIIKSKLSWSRTRAKYCQLIASLSVILLQLKPTKFNLEVFKSDFQHKRKIYADKRAINWQNFAQVRLQLKFAFVIQSIRNNSISCSTSKYEL